MRRSPSARQLLILDCCHSGAIGEKGAALDAETFGGTDPSPNPPPSAPPGGHPGEGYGRFTLTSSTAAEVSFEGNRFIDGAERSLFTHFLIQGLATGEAAAGAPTVDVDRLYAHVHARVRAATAGAPRRMTPMRFVHAQEGELLVARNPRALPPDLLADLAADGYRTRLGAVHELEELAEDPVRAEAVRGVLAARLAVERDFKVRGRIERVLAGLNETRNGAAAAAGPPRRAAQTATPEPRAREPFSVFRDRLKDGSEGPEMVVIPAGEFWMGSPEDEPERGPDETRHRVAIERAFAIGRYAVTFEEYDRFAAATGPVRSNDRDWGRNRRPVMNVSWLDAMDFTAWLAGETGRPYRLPSEAEWEYAARAGTETPFYTGDCIGTDQANYDGNHDYAGCGAKTGVYRKQTLPVGSLPANPWGLFDMAGNVWEWTGSVYAPYGTGQEANLLGKSDAKEDRACLVIRGGSWNNRPARLRSAGRSWGRPSGRFGSLGFRVAEDL